MKKLLFLVRYIKYFINSRSRYRVHSQFVFDFINNVLRNKNEYADYKILWENRNILSRSNDPIETVDFGFKSGKRNYSTKIIPLKRIIKLRSPKKSRLELLYRIVKQYKPNNILEFGTAAGISASYIKSGHKESKMVSMEGCSNLAARANSLFEELDLKNIELAVGNFDNTLDDVLAKFSTLDLVFFDGNHRKEPTLRYFNKCVQLSNENSIFVFDDIHWSSGMESAWEGIKNDNRVSITLDLFWFGIVFFRKGIEKQNFVLVY
jgi:predicted O-methyltransferase YrrM